MPGVGLPAEANRVMREFVAVSYLFSPLLLGLTAHGVCIKFNWLTPLSRPIDRGRKFLGRRIFGANKTYRGVVAVGLGTALGFLLQAALLHRFPLFRGIELFDYTTRKALWLGFAVGAAAMLSELPNSFIKRRLGISPGEAVGGYLTLVFYALDQIDLLVGAWLVLALAVEVTLARVIWSAVFLFITHQIITTLGYMLGMRATAR